MGFIKLVALGLLVWFFSNFSNQIDKKYERPKDSVRQTTSSSRP